MDANILAEIASGFGMAGGMWALVRWSNERRENGNGNGNGHAPVSIDAAAMSLAQRNMAQNIAELPKQLEGSLKPLSRQLSDLIGQLSAPVSTPAWAITLAQHLASSDKRMEQVMAQLAADRHAPAPELAWPPEMQASLACVTDRLEALIQMGPPPAAEAPPELAELARGLAQLPGEIQSGFERLAKGWDEWAAMERRLLMSVKNAGGGGGGGGKAGGGAPMHHVLAPQPKSPGITLAMFNTWSFVGNTVYTLTPPEPGIFAINLLNLGPGNLYLRADADPAPGDPQSSTLPAGVRDQRVFVPGSLRVLADAETEVTARVVHQ